MSHLGLTVVIGACTGLLAFVARDLIGRVIASKHESTNQIECALRRDQPDGVVTGRWLHGLATLSPGEITFQPRKSGLRLNSGLPFVIPVHSAPSDTGRRPSLRQSWSINPRLQIVSMETPTGSIELAATRRSILQLFSKVDQPAG